MQLHSICTPIAMQVALYIKEIKGKEILISIIIDICQKQVLT